MSATTTVTTAAATIRRMLDDAVACLEDAGVPRARVDAEWLLAGMLGVGRARLAVDGNRELPPPMIEAFEAAVRRRAAREPLQQILGGEHFMDLRIRVTPDVLVPRPETEVLVEWLLALLPPRSSRPLRVADVGTGSGCIACAVSAARDDVGVLAIDLSAAAARIAADNIRALAARARVIVADALDAVCAGSLDAVVANPPYLTDAEVEGLAPEVARFEPRVALAGGPDGRRVLDRLVDDAARVLRPGGVLVVESGGAAHVEALLTRLDARGFEARASHADLAGVVRFVAGRAPAERRA